MRGMDDIDLARYPLDRPGAPEWRALVDWAQQELAETGMFNLEGFLRPEVCQASAADLSPRFAQEAFRHARDHNIYFSDAVRDVPADHPALRRFDTANYTLCGDQVYLMLVVHRCLLGALMQILVVLFAPL